MSNVMHFAETTVIKARDRPSRAPTLGKIRRNLDSQRWSLLSSIIQAMEKHSHMESTEEQMFTHFHSQFPCRGTAGQRWKDVHQIRGCQPQRHHLRWQLCANWAHVHLVTTRAALERF